MLESRWIVESQPGNRAGGISVGVCGGAYGWGVIQGVARYINRRTSWWLRLPANFGAYIEDLDSRHVRGLIVQMLDPGEAAEYGSLAVPVVNVADNHDERSLPTVHSDNRAIGVMAAEHLLDLGYRHFAFYGIGSHWYARQRHAGFVERLRQTGCAVHAQWGSEEVAWNDTLLAWLGALPRPVGLMTDNDQRALTIMHACEEIGLEVPRDVAVLGVDNDEGICEVSRIPISSVAVNAEKVGYEAAALLDRLIAGEAPPQRPIEIPPIAVQQRESTGRLVVRDALVSKAMGAIRESIAETRGIEAIAATLGVSRRHLDRRFRDALGRTAAEELRRLRIERARQLLEATNRKVLDIALDCGFSDAKSLSTAFRATLGMSATAYRRRVQMEPERAS